MLIGGPIQQIEKKAEGIAGMNLEGKDHFNRATFAYLQEADDQGEETAYG